MTSRITIVSPYLTTDISANKLPRVMIALSGETLQASAGLTPEQARLAAEDLMKAATEAERLARG